LLGSTARSSRSLLDLAVDPNKSTGVDLDIQIRVGSILLRAVDSSVEFETTSDFIPALLHRTRRLKPTGKRKQNPTLAK